jgi:hypothetical protein
MGESLKCHRKKAIYKNVVRVGKYCLEKSKQQPLP